MRAPPLLLGPSFFGLVLLGTGCSHVRQLPNGAYRVQCQERLEDCREEAELYCQTRGGVEEVSTREKDDLHGVEGHERGVLVSEVVFHCGDTAPREAIALPPRAPADAKRADDGATPAIDPGLVAPEPTPAAPAGKRICIPGSTQRCIGPGACVGAQGCNADALAWGPCDCGPTTPPAPSSSRPPLASAPAASARPLQERPAESPP